jgi:hypothetical protein
MTQCCNDFGNCTQGRDCPIRKQRAKEADDAYINRGRWGSVADPYNDITDTFKALIIVIAVTGALTLLAFFIWGK